MELATPKRLLAALIAIFMVISLAACGDSPSTSGDPQPDAAPTGTEHTTEAEGHNGKVSVKTTIGEDGAIIAVEVIEHDETPGISDAALEQIPVDIVTHQSIAVDTISGATVSSNAVIEAVGLAIVAAGLDVADYSHAPDVDTEQEEDLALEADVIVIGAGGAGLAAAVSAHQEGASVIVLEKMPSVGGNTIISGAAYNAVDPVRQEKADPPIEDSIDLHYQQTYEGGDERGNPELVRTLVEGAPEGIVWLESLGMEFTDEVFTVLGGLWPRAHKPVKPLGTGYIETYLDYVNANDIQLLLETTATELIAEDGTVTGVIATGKTGNTITLTANKGVVLATGGFGANIEMRQAYNTQWPDLSTIKSTNHPGATGDGLAMAEAVGANLVDLELIQLLPMGDPNTGSLSGNIEQGVENRIFINKDGNRFVDEGERRDVMTQALFEQEDSYMWVILDQHSYPTGDTKNNFNETIDQLIDEGRAFKADTLEELAELIDVDPANLVAAVETFNAAVDGAADPFGRTLFMDKIDTAPFYAGARMPTVHHTMGGVQINTDTQVLNADGEVIPGLYAAGEITGGIHGTNRLGGNALADITVFGRIAGQNAAQGK